MKDKLRALLILTTILAFTGCNSADLSNLVNQTENETTEETTNTVTSTGGTETEVAENETSWLIGKTLYVMKEKEDNPVVKAISFKQDSMDGYGVYLTNFSSFDSLLSPEYLRWSSSISVDEDG